MDVLNLLSSAVSQVVGVVPSAVVPLLELCSIWGALPAEPGPLLLLPRDAAGLLLQPNPSPGCPGSSSVTELHTEEEGVRWREEQTLLTLVSP